MGQKSFYANLEESDCEESDDELVGEDLTEERFNSQVGELIKAIVTGDIELEVGLINLRQTKHGSDKDNITFQNAILPAVLNELVKKCDSTMKTKDKLNEITKFVKMF